MIDIRETVSLWTLSSGSIKQATDNTPVNLGSGTLTTTGNTVLGKLGIGVNPPVYPLDIQASYTAIAGKAIGASLSQSLVASANNDYLFGLFVNPTMTVGAYTGVKSHAIASMRNSDDVNSTSWAAFKSRGSFGTPLACVSGDYLGEVVGYGHDGSNYIRSASIRFKSSGTIAGTRVPSQIEFWTGTDALPSVETNRGKIDTDGTLKWDYPINTVNSYFKAIRDNIVTTSTDAVWISKSTNATVGVPVQMSGRVRWTGSAWETTGGTPQTVDWIIENLPVSGATASSILKFGHSLNGVAYTYPMTLTSAGDLTTSGFVYASNLYAANGGSIINYGTSTIFNLGVGTATTSATWSRNTADAYSVAVINNLHASSTGNILDLQWQSITKSYFRRFGSLVLGAGSATALSAPLYLTSGTLLSSPEAGAVEFLTDKYYATITTGTARKEFALCDRYYGEMYIYENSTAETVDTNNVYKAVRNFSTGTVNGFTFGAGSTGAITAFADYSGTVPGTVLVTDVGHGLLTGMTVTILGTTNYNGTFTITKVSNDTFYITDTWVADDATGNWYMGSYLKADVGSAGTYRLSFNITADSASSGESYKAEANKNATALDNIASERNFGTGTDYGQLTASGLVTVSDGDYLWLSFKQKSAGTDNFLVYHANFNVQRL